MPNPIQDQINAMIDAGGPTEPPSTDPPGTDAPGTDAPGTSAPTTYSPGTDAPGTDAPSTDAPATTAPVTAAPEDDALTKALAEIDGLKRTVDELTRKKKKPATAAPTTAVPVVDTIFLDEETDFRDLTTKDLNKLLNKVFRMGEESRRKSQESTLRSIPEIVKSNVVTQTTLKKASENFYNNNKDLIPWKKAVAEVFGDTASGNPGDTFEELLDKTGKEVRKRLGLQKKTVITHAPVTTAPKGPKFPKVPGHRTKTKPKTSGLLKDIDDMNRPLE